MLNMRPARTGDAPTLRRWDEAPHIVAIMGDDPPENWDAELAHEPDWREWWIAELEGRAIGIVQIIDPARETSRYWGDVAPNLRAIDIWIGEPDCLGQGHGTRMMTHALDRCFRQREVTAVLIDPLTSNRRARKFYEVLGFREVGPRRFGTDDCVVYRLDREDWAAR